MPSLKENGKRLNGKGSGWLPRWKRLAIYLRDGFTCGYCGKNLRKAHPREVTLDHLKPQCKGGTHHESNLITACLSCNSRRQHMVWTAFIALSHPAMYAELSTRIRRIRRHALNKELAKDLLKARQTARRIGGKDI